MESKGEGSSKALDSVKKTLLDLSDQHESKSRVGSKQTVNSLNELTDAVCTSSTRSSKDPLLLSKSIEVLVYAYSSIDQDIRLCASENLRKLIKALMSMQLFKIQQSLFHELKKNGAARSVSIALECFSSLVPRTRPQKCHNLSHQFHPVLMRIMERPEEIIHEKLVEALPNILPIMTPFLSSNQVQSLMTQLYHNLPKSSASYRRMVSSAISLLCLHCKAPVPRTEWIITKMIGQATAHTASQHVIQGVLLTLYQLLLNYDKLDPSLSAVKQMYSLCISAMLYGEQNTINSALEVLEQLLQSASTEFSLFLTSTASNPSLAPNFWTTDTTECLSLDEKSESGSQLEAPCEEYFEFEDSFEASNVHVPTEVGNDAINLTPPKPTSQVSSLRSGRGSPTSSTDSWALSTVSLTDESCFASLTSSIPLQDLVVYIKDHILTHKRVSIKSVGLSVISASLNIDRNCITDLSNFDNFFEAEDPKLVSHMTDLLSCLITAELRACDQNIAKCRPLVAVACKKIHDILSSEVAVVLKAACESLQLCLPLLLSSTHPNEGVKLLRKLMNLIDVNYWLLKVELLQTLAVIDYAQLAVVEPSLLSTILDEVVFPLISDPDHRVRGAVCNTLMKLAKTLDQTNKPLPLLALQHVKMFFDHLHAKPTQLSLAGIGRTDSQIIPSIPSCLEIIVWHCMVVLGSSQDQVGQKGALEVLCILSEEYPPPTLPNLWGVKCSDCGLLEMLLQLSRGSWLSRQVQTHTQLLQISTSLFLACALDSLHQAASEGHEWDRGIERVGVVRHSTTLLLHLIKLLNVFQHVIDGKDPEDKETKNVILKKMETLSPKGKSSAGDHPPVSLKEMIGSVIGCPNYLKLYESLSAAYTNYQVSINPSSDDKFSIFLTQLHNCLAAVLEVSLAEEVGRHVEELVGYLTATMKVDAPGALLCMQQLLNALFGMNVATQQTHIYSPFLCSLPYTLKAPPTTTPSDSLVECLVNNPVQLMYQSLRSPISGSSSSSPFHHVYPKNKQNRLWLFGTRSNMVLKPTNSLSSIKEYLVHFEPIIISSISLFAITSSILIQERVLYMIVQLLHLKVRYELLDCNRTFFESVNKQVALMESGNVGGGPQLVPHLFQFLVMLANDSKLISIPEVIQKCDSVTASGKNVATFAVPALRPLVIYLFVRPTGKISEDLATQREVTLNMLLRLVNDPNVIDLLISILECYQSNAQEWQNTSSLIYAFLLAPIGRLQVELDTMSAVSSLHHLFATMTPSSISIQALVVAHLKQTNLSSPLYLTRWLAILSCILRLIYTIPEDRFFAELEGIKLVAPAVQYNGVEISVASSVESNEPAGTALCFAGFLMDSLAVTMRCVRLILQHHQQKEVVMLATVVADVMILIKTLIERDFPLLKSSLSGLSLPDGMLESLVGVSQSFPLIPLHFFSLLVSSWFDALNDCMKWFLSSFSVPVSPNQQLLLQSVILIVPEPEMWAESLDPALIYDHFGGEDMMNFTKKACHDEQFNSKLKSHILSLSTSSITDCVKAISLIRCLTAEGKGEGMELMRLVADQLITHPVRGINEEAESLLLEMLPSCQSSPDQLEELITALQPVRNRVPKVWTILQTMMRTSSPNTMATFDPLSETTNETLLMEINKEWQIGLINNSICSSPIPSHSLPPGHHSSFSALLYADLLLVLQKQDIMDIMRQSQFPSYMVEECIVQAVFHLLSRKNSKSSIDYATPIIATPLQYEALLVACVEIVFQFIEKYIADHDNSSYQIVAPYMARSLLWLLLSWSQVITSFSLNEENAENCLSFAEKFLDSIWKSFPLYDSVAMETALDLCSLVLHIEETSSCISSEWACSIVSKLTGIFEQEFSTSFSSVDGNEGGKAVDIATEQLRWIFSQLLALPPLDSSPSIHLLTISLSRLTFFSFSLTIPPLLLSMSGGVVTETELDKSLVDADILMEYMQRINTMGWSSKNQFEERWMQLLGVLNMSSPSEEMPVEEQLAHNMGLCMGVRSATSVLLGTSLRPFAGNPLWSVPLHTHRNKDFNFLSSPAGKKLLPHRSFIESQLILDCADRSHCHSHYQIPFKHEVLAQTYPPVFSQNLERPIGSFAIMPCQLSYTCLLPIILKTGFSRSGSPSAIDGVDLRSCVISLIELFTHWFTLPINLLHLHNTLTSIVMLSDLFFLSTQFEWMLHTFLNLSQSHPQEDLLSEPLVVFGILKAAAILRVDGLEAEKVSKIVELATSPDAFVNTQNACLEGMLFIVENAESAILSLVGPSIARYILNHLEQYQNYSERHLLLVWSLGTHLALLQAHSQPTKDPSYTTHLLELISFVLCDQHTSSRVVRAILLGLEHMVLSFSLSSKDKSSLTQLAANRFMKSDHSKSLSALALLLTCMYTGEEADRVSGLAIPQDNMADLKDSVYQSRENISNLLERLRQGNQTEVEFLVHLLPGVIVDFLPPMDAMNTVVTDVISQQQTRPWMAAMMMFKTFELLIQAEMDPTKPSGQTPTVMDWVLLSLDSFIQQEPERHAVWCITCLLMAGSINPILRAVYPVVVHKVYPDEEWLDKMLCTVTYLLYNQNNFPQDQKKGFAEKFQKSPYTILHRLVHCLK